MSTITESLTCNRLRNALHVQMRLTTLPVSEARAPVSADNAVHTTVILTPVGKRGSSGILIHEEMLPSTQAIDEALAGQSPMMPLPIANCSNFVLADSDSGSELESTYSFLRQHQHHKHNSQEQANMEHSAKAGSAGAAAATASLDFTSKPPAEPGNYAGLRL
eukprot:6178783-Pleurochrysis_carterae.AAC.2